MLQLFAMLRANVAHNFQMLSEISINHSRQLGPLVSLGISESLDNHHCVESVDYSVSLVLLHLVVVLVLLAKFGVFQITYLKRK
jgi:hypothetical protein